MLKRPTKIILTAAVGLLLAVPVPALASVNPDAQSAAAAGIAYLGASQQADGSISGFGGESEWSAIAVAAAGQNPSSFAHGGASLLDFLKTDVPGAGTPATTIERNLIAVAAAGQDPANFGSTDYKALLAAQHQSGQIGDPTLLNDDIFGIIAIDAAHDTALLPVAQDALDYLLAHQGSDGGFSYTTTSCAWCGADNNDTAAALIALYAANDLGLTNGNLDTAKTAALTFLLQTQQSDGGFGYDAASPSDGSSTAWSLMALNTLGSTVSAPATSARDWLLQNQNPDGGFSFGAYGTTSSDTSTTAHAVTALLGSTWLLRPAPLALSGDPLPPSGGLGSGTPVQIALAESPGANQPPAPVSSGGTVPDQTQATSGNDTGSSDADPQVKGAASATSGEGKQSKIVANKSGQRYGIYAMAGLILAAAIWFVLESRKASRRANHED